MPSFASHFAQVATSLRLSRRWPSHGLRPSLRRSFHICRRRYERQWPAPRQRLHFFRWPSLRRELLLILALKSVLLLALWWWFFSPSHRVDPTPEKLSEHFDANPVAPNSTTLAPPTPVAAREEPL